MFCRNCGYQISDTAKFCSKCGSAITPAYIPQSDTPQTQSVFPISPAISSEDKFKMIKYAIALGSGALLIIVYAFSFFSPMINIYGDSSYSRFSITEMLQDDVFEYYNAFDAIGAIFFILLLSLVLSIFSFLHIRKTNNIAKGFIYGGGICYAVALMICTFSDYCEPNGKFIVFCVLFVLAIVLAEYQIKLSFAGASTSATSTSSLLSAIPKHLLSHLTMETNIPSVEDFETLLDGSTLREHLFKTHPNNQLYNSVYQQLYSKFSEMIKSPSPTNIRHFKYTDNKNTINVTLKYDNKIFECDILINM